MKEATKIEAPFTKLSLMPFVFDSNNPVATRKHTYLINKTGIILIRYLHMHQLLEIRLF